MRESHYKDGLDSVDIDVIDQLSDPWMRVFLKRFYLKLEEKNYSKKDICDLVNSIPNKLVDVQYRLNESTLSQYTNFKNASLRSIPINALLSISQALDVSVEYLLGIEDSENHVTTDIHKETGLSSKAINNLMKKTEVQKVLDFFLQSERLDYILNQVKKVYYSELIKTHIFNSYSEALLNIITSAYDKFMQDLLPIEHSPDMYKKYLVEELKLSNLKIDEEYLINNISEDRFFQIKQSCSDKLDLFSLFVDDTVCCVYDLLVYSESSDYYRSLLSKSIIDVIDEYLAQKMVGLSLLTHFQK